MPNNNPTGKGGFKERPQDINVGGRPISYFGGILRDIGNEVESKSGKTFKELVGRRLWIDAINGNINAIKEVINRLDGLPQVYTDLTTNGKDITPVLVQFIDNADNKDSS